MPEQKKSKQKVRYEKISRNETIRYNADGTKTRLVRKRRSIFGVHMGIDLPFLIVTLVLVAVGLVMMFSASYYYAYQTTGNSFYYFQRQAIFAVAGVLIMMLISYFDYHHLRKFVVPLIVLSWILLVVVLILPKVNEVHRWINLGFFSFQPSEIAKFAVILWLANFISIHQDKMKEFVRGVLPNLFVIAVTAALVVVEPHLSATIIIALIAGFLLFIGGVKKRVLGVLLLLAVAAVALLLLIKGGYQAGRISNWFNVFEYVDSEQWNDTWQTRNSLYAIGSGGLFGMGLGNSHQKLMWLPEPQNDFVFAIVCEELGFIGALIIIIIFGILVYRGVKIGIMAKDKFGMLLCIGIALQIGLQVFLNIGVVTNTLPNTGISLPFFSYGGTSLIILLAQMGIVLSVSRQQRQEQEIKEIAQQTIKE